jgi:hypothetical protein
MSIKPYRVLGFVLALLLAAPELMAASVFERPVPEGGGATLVKHMTELETSQRI